MELFLYVVIDVIVGYNFVNGVSLIVGIDNLFNCVLLIGIIGMGLIDGVYDNIGCFGYVIVVYKM